MGTDVDLGVQNSRVRLLWIMNQKSPQNVVEAIVFILSDGKKIVSSHQMLLIHALGNFKPTAGQLAPQLAEQPNAQDTSIQRFSELIKATA